MIKRKVFFISNSTLCGDDARTTHTIELISHLTEGFSCYLFTPKSSKYAKSNFKVIGIPNAFNIKMNILKEVFNQLLLPLILFRECKRENPDILYVRQAYYSFGHLIVCSIMHIPFVLEVNGWTPDEILANKNGFKLVNLIKMLSSRINNHLNFTHSRKIITVTKGLKDIISKSNHVKSEKIIVIGNGANTRLFKPMDKKRCMSELGLDQSYTYVCFVGSFQPWQGIDQIIKASPGVITLFPMVKFLIVGDGINKKKMMSLVPQYIKDDHFIFTGLVDYCVVPKYINASDICLAPFISDRNKRIGLSPLKIFEYGSCGKPIITTKIPNMEIIESNNMGIVIEPEDLKQLIDAIVQLLENEKLQTEMGANARKYMEENCSWEVTATSVSRVLFKELC